jgi:hypothetical protein
MNKFMNAIREASLALVLFFIAWALLSIPYGG